MKITRPPTTIGRYSLITAIISALLAGGFIYFSKPITKRLVKLFFSGQMGRVTPEVAIASAISGDVKIRRAHQTDFLPLMDGAPVRHNDQLIVGAQSDVILEFHSGYKLRLTPHSHAAVEYYHPDDDKNSPALLTVTEGDYELMSLGNLGQLFVMKDRQVFSAEAKPKPVSKSTIIALPPTSPELPLISDSLISDSTPAPDVEDSASPAPRVKLPEKIKTRDGETLTTPYIEAVLADHSEDLRRCQLKSIRDNQMADGHLLLSMTIEPSGRVDAIRFLRNDLRNDQLASCVQTVIERTKFKSYAGEPITITYPVEFR